MENKYDAQLKIVFDAIRQLMIPPAPKEKNEFLVKEARAVYAARKRKK